MAKSKRQGMAHQCGLRFNTASGGGQSFEKDQGLPVQGKCWEVPADTVSSLLV